MNFKLNVAKLAALSLVTAAVAAPPFTEGPREQNGLQTQKTCVEGLCDNDRLPNQVPVEQDSAPTGDATPDTHDGADTSASPVHSVPGSDIASAGAGATPEAAASVGAGGVIGAPVTQGSLPGAGGKKKGAPVRGTETGAIQQN